MSRKEKMVLLYLCRVCSQKRTYLISPHQIASNLSKNFVLSVSEIDEIMTNLSKENFIDFVVSETKNDYMYCVTLRKKGQSFELDLKNQKKTFGLLILRTLFLAIISFIFGLILKAIFI